MVLSVSVLCSIDCRMINEYGAVSAIIISAGSETEVLGGNLSQFIFVHHKSHMS
jgi:hypothetical protein